VARRVEVVKGARTATKKTPPAVIDSDQPDNSYATVLETPDGVMLSWFMVSGSAHGSPRRRRWRGR
jgi:hypothetical protein